MTNKPEKREIDQDGDPGSMSSFNNRKENRQGKVEEVKENKDTDEAYMDYNGNSEANAPARAREEE